MKIDEIPGIKVEKNTLNDGDSCPLRRDGSARTRGFSAPCVLNNYCGFPGQSISKLIQGPNMRVQTWKALRCLWSPRSVSKIFLVGVCRSRECERGRRCVQDCLSVVSAGLG